MVVLFNDFSLFEPCTAAKHLRNHCAAEAKCRPYPRTPQLDDVTKAEGKEARLYGHRREPPCDRIDGRCRVHLLSWLACSAKMLVTNPLAGFVTFSKLSHDFRAASKSG